MTAASVAPNEKCSEDRGAAFPTCGSGLARDSALHAAMRGRAMMEQTFYLDPAAIADRTHSPEAVLSRMLGKPMLPQH